MKAVFITTVSVNVANGITCAVLASTGGKTTGGEAIVMAACGLIGIGAMLAAAISKIKNGGDR